MEHVSTLCAIGTVGIAATGFALGKNEAIPQQHQQQQQQQQQPPPTAKRRRSVFRGSFSSPLACVLDMSSPVDSLLSPTSPTRPASAHVASLRRTEDFSGSRLDASNPGLECSMERPLEGPKTRPRRRTYVESVSRRGDDESPISPSFPSPSGRPSSSWLRRISMISSQNDSPMSGSRPDSPSLNGSTSPFFSSPFRAEQGPNKLVKRPASQRGPTNSNTTRSSGSFGVPTPLLRRPATSHQRLANMRQRSSTDSRVQLGPPFSPLHDPDQTPSETLDPLPSTTWRPYFQPYYSRGTDNGKRSSARHRARSPRRLVPEPNVAPTLLLSPSITRDTSKCRTDCNGAWMSDDERPMSRDSIKSSDAIPDEQPAGSVPMGERKSRQSFSIGEMITGTSPNSWKLSAAKSMGRRRGFSFSKERSAEHPSPSDDLGAKIEALNLNSARFRKRRTITNSDTFRRPSTSSQAEYNFHELDTINSESNSPKSRLRRLPRYSELRAELSPGPITCNIPLDSGSRSSSGEQSSDPSGNTFSTSSGPTRTQRLSAATSDPASTLVGSDNDTRIFSSGDEDELDFQSDTCFDSFPTRVGVGGPPAHRGPRIETIFDRPSSLELADEKLRVLENLNTEVSHAEISSEQFSANIDCSLKVDASISLSTAESGSSRKQQPNPPTTQPTESTENPNDDSLDWSILDEMECLDDQKVPYPESRPSQAHQGLSIPRSNTDRPFSSVTLDETSSRARMSLFDWSEKQRSDKDSQGSDFRPKTAHGKQAPETRGGRTVTRRGTSAVHLRSQSVPLSREPSLNNAHQSSPKFGTWGLGNKGATEDWDGDFEFEDLDKQDGAKDDGVQTKFALPNQGMKVPKAIMERQASVHGQFGHVQELTLLVEELKRLRIRARNLSILDGPSSELWKEAKGIINLATLEEDEDEGGLTAKHLLPSPTFSAVEDLEDDFFADGQTKAQTSSVKDDTRRSPLSERINSSHSITPPPRPRTDSSIKAKFVLDTIHQQRGLNDPAYLESTIDPTQKLPFDTQSLRDLVIRAGVVTRALKEIIRKAEGVCAGTPETDHRPQDPPFSQMFARPLHNVAESSPSCLPDLARSKNTNGYRGIATGNAPNENDGCERMTMMTVV
ncbi:hypothetical protein AJ79_09687 [Helicocarpus griseus UAMH5409]|uniref:Uncharacterized protein n=1 Tax=Helicocarpus griseus UAMH5409 TaxID=1447875 RepID=A0A2B7WHY3_9EURO|nr:hypothetical protein AJ79_09687 [Helicocarpus griseus UAMH5409]